MLYYKYGFKFVSSDEHKLVKENCKLIKQKVTKDLNFDDLINIINVAITENSNIFKSEPINFDEKIISNIKIVYDAYYELEICRFFNKFSRYFCELMSIIWTKLFKHLKLQIINGELMIKKL